MKKWYESRTIWLNIISALIELANLLMDNPIIPKNMTGVLTIVVNILNVALRFLTNTGIEVNSNEKK